MDPRSNGMKALVAYLSRLPATRVLSTSEDNREEAEALAAILRKEMGAAFQEPNDRRWWVKLTLDIRAHMAWHVVQELGCVLNYLSIGERLPTVFKPTSSAPSMNGGPDGYLHWVIESTVDDFSPRLVAMFLERRLPQPVEDPSAWTRCGAEPCDVPDDAGEDDDDA